MSAQDNNNVAGAYDRQAACEGHHAGLQAQALLLLAEQAATAPTAPPTIPAAPTSASPTQQGNGHETAGDVVASELEATLRSVARDDTAASTAAHGPLTATQRGPGQATPSGATYRGAVEMVRLGCQNALRTLAREDAVADAAAPALIQQGTVTPPPSATATAIVSGAPDCSDFLLQAISNVANGSVASGNPQGTSGMMPPPGLLNRLGPQVFPGYFPDPFGWSMQQPPPPFFCGASLNPFSVPAMPWSMPGYQPSRMGYWTPTGMMAPPPPAPPMFSGPTGPSGIAGPPPPASVAPRASFVTPPAPVRDQSTPDKDLAYIPSTPTPQRRTTPARDASSPDSDIEILETPRLRCMAPRRVPPTRAQSPVAAVSDATRSSPPVNHLRAMHDACDRALTRQKSAQTNAGFESSESEPTTTPPAASATSNMSAAAPRLRQLLTATPRSSHVSVRARVTGIELGRSQTIGPPGPSRQRPIYRTEVGCPVPVGTVRQQRDRVERLCLLNPPTQLRPPSATYKRKATDLPSSTGLPRQVLGRLDNDAAGSPPKRQCSSRQTSEQAGNDENQPPQPGAPATTVERGVQTTVRIGVMGGSADWMLRGGIALNGSEGWRAAALREAYAAAMGYGGQAASPDLLLAWVRDFIAFMRDFRADALAEHYFYGIVMRWLTRPVPNYGLPRRVPDDEGYVRRSVQHAVGIARRPNDPEYAAPLLYTWIMGWNTGIVSSRRAAAQAANAPPPSAGPQDPTSDL
ncbi:hypothetical protein AAVH_08049 [Aphelenchoides avenae]|nr:hypothetical protein AAVH_08049 [Aphelenchus avenae]